MSLTIRPAVAEDAGLVHALIRELGEYEKLGDEIDATEAEIAAALFGERPRVFCDIAEQDGEPAGFALWFYNYSTFRGRHGIYLEDLFVRPAFRRRGVARAMLARLATRCGDEKLARFEWSVLKWNAPAIAFYESLGAVAMDGWTVYRVDGAALARLRDEVRQRGGPRVGDKDLGI